MAADSSDEGREEPVTITHSDDLCERRRQQNREAQRRFRNKRTQQRLAEAQAALSLSHPPPAGQASSSDPRAGSPHRRGDISRAASPTRRPSHSIPISSGFPSSSLPSGEATGTYFHQRYCAGEVPQQGYTVTPVYPGHRSSLPTTPLVLPPGAATFNFSYDPNQQILPEQHMQPFCGTGFSSNEVSTAAPSTSTINEVELPEFLDLGHGLDTTFPDVAALSMMSLPDTGDIGADNLLLQSWLKTDAPLVFNTDPFTTANTSPSSLEDLFSTPGDEQGKSKSSTGSISDTSPPAMLLANRRAVDRAGQPLLHLSIESGHESIVRVLLDSGVDINERDERGSAGVHVAVKTRQDGILRLLLERGADANVVDQEERTPTQLAIMTGFETGLRLLLKHNCPLNKLVQQDAGRPKETPAVS